jgi:leucyl/phenylalanyl-tRNA--protein transferase
MSPRGSNPPTKLEAELLIAAYASGYFPMADSRYGRIGWYSPDPRAVIPLETFKVPRSLKQTLRKNLFSVRLNTAFEAVIRSCAARAETWISEEIVQSYLELHPRRYAHSVEAWRDNTLAGGLYGVSIGGAFFGESMFSRYRDASKVALVYLVNRLRERRFELLDTQWTTPHLAQFGTVELRREEYLGRLRRAIEQKTSFID